MNGQVHMSREFSDELLSAYLDGELGPEERAAVEQQVAASEADHQLLNELRMLRSELASLPTAALKPDFADRVVQMAIAAAEVPPQRTVVHLPVRRLRYWHVGVAVAAIAACVLVVVQPWLFEGPGNPDVGVAVGDPADDGIDKALVIRLRPKDPAAVALLEAALSEGGIQTRDPSDVIPDESRVRVAYKQQRQARNESSDETVPASGALYLEVSVDKLKTALAAVTNGKQALELVSEQRLALPELQGARVLTPEGEIATGKAAKEFPAGQPFMKPLRGADFRLEKDLQSESAASSGSAFEKNGKPVRVLILIEPVDSQ
jgi:anti-sigma factor RsiW